MKGLKKIALVTAIAAVPVIANAQLKAMNDSALGQVTGQGGVTIELTTQASIGSITYTDTGTDALSGGSMQINGVKIGGAGIYTAATGNAAGIALDASGNPVTTTLGASTTQVPVYGDLGAGVAQLSSNLDDAALLIDINKAGDATIDLGSLSGAPVDWGVALGYTTDASGNTTSNGNAIQLKGTSGSTTLVSNLAAWGLLGALNITAYNNDYTPVGATAAVGAIGIQSAFSIQDMQFDAPVVALGVRGLSVHAAGYLAAAAAGDLATAAADNLATTSMTLYKSAPTGSSVTLLGATGPVAVAQSATSALAIDVAVSPMDINMNQVLVGGVSIGSVAISNLAVTNTTLKIYGH